MEPNLADALQRAASGTWSYATVVSSGVEKASFSSGPSGGGLEFSLSDVSALPGLFISKAAALENGLPLRSTHSIPFAVHHFFPSARLGLDVVYGRAGDASSGEGAAVVRLYDSSDVPPSPEDIYVLVTYKLPVVSALAVPKLVTFADSTIRPLMRSTTPV